MPPLSRSFVIFISLFCLSLISAQDISCTNCGDAAHVTDYTCTINTCDSGYHDCDGLVVTGCESEAATDVNNCGVCNNVCSFYQATPACVGGSCAIASCNSGFENCNAVQEDGCEIDTQNDVNNCGACGNACPVSHDSVACVAGQCVITTCEPGFFDCNGLPSDGCEINLTDDTENCGTCNNVCSFANASPLCVAGLCVLGECDPGYLNCDGDSSNGCEINSLDDTNNCGICGVVCSYPNGSPVCNAGTCNLASCNPGYSNCNEIDADGCEINLTNDELNCGSCGDVCIINNDVPECTAGTCTVASCLPGFFDCNSVPSDGCEVPESPENCGACGSVCNLPHATASCVASK